MDNERMGLPHEAVEVAPLAQEATPPVQTFRQVDPDAANAIRRELEQRNLVSAAKAGRDLTRQLYEMRLSPDLARGVREGRMYQVADGTGLLSMVKDKETGGIVGQARFGKLGRVEVAGPAVWDLAATVTQQHYLVEISQKLGEVDQTVRELLERTRDKQWAHMRELESELDRIAGRASQVGVLSDLDRHELDRWLTELGRLRREALSPIDRAPEDCDGVNVVREPDEYTSDFAVAAFATQLTLQAAQLKVSLGHEPTLASHVSQEEQARCLNAVSELVQTAALLVASSDYWTEEWAHFNQARPRNVAVRLWNRGAPLVKADWQTEAASPPPGKPLTLVQRDRLRSLAAATSDAERPRTLLALEPDGSVSVSDAFT